MGEIYSHFCSKNINVFENTLAATFNEFVINELVKLTMLWPTGPWYLWTVYLPSRPVMAQETASIFTEANSNSSKLANLFFFVLKVILLNKKHCKSILIPVIWPFLHPTILQPFQGGSFVAILCLRFDHLSLSLCLGRCGSRMISEGVWWGGGGGFDLIKLSYLLYVFGQEGLSKQCRSRSDAA